MNIEANEDEHDISANANAIAAIHTARRIQVPIADSADGDELRRLGQEHASTGRPVLIRHRPLLSRVAEGVPVERLSWLLSLFGKVDDADAGFAYSLKLRAKTVFRDEMLRLAESMALTTDPGSPGLTYVGERVRYNRKGKEFHAGPGQFYKFLLMVKGCKRWDFVAPEFTPFMGSFELGMCGVRSSFRSAEALDALHPSLSAPAPAVPEVHTGLHEEGMVLLFSSQWWHSTYNLTDETFQVANKLANSRVYNEVLYQRELERKREKAAQGPGGEGEEYCSRKTEQNTIGTLMWSQSFLGE